MQVLLRRELTEAFSPLSEYLDYTYLQLPDGHHGMVILGG